MYDILFKDYIDKYKKINREEWIVLYDKNEVQNLENDVFTFTSTATSRAFYAWMNFESPVTSDPAGRKAIAMGI